jgi:hypothetical protein
MLVEIKQALAAQLQPLSAEAKILIDDTSGEGGFTAEVRQNYQVRIGYASGSFDPPATTNDVQFQTGTRQFQVAIEFKDLRSEDRAVALTEQAERLLIGFYAQVEEVTGEAYLESDRFRKFKDGIYFYEINVSIPCITSRTL